MGVLEASLSWNLLFFSPFWTLLFSLIHGLLITTYLCLCFPFLLFSLPFLWSSFSNSCFYNCSLPPLNHYFTILRHYNILRQQKPTFILCCNHSLLVSWSRHIFVPFTHSSVLYCSVSLVYVLIPQDSFLLVFSKSVWLEHSSTTRGSDDFTLYLGLLLFGSLNCLLPYWVSVHSRVFLCPWGGTSFGSSLRNCPEHPRRKLRERAIWMSPWATHQLTNPYRQISGETRHGSQKWVSPSVRDKGHGWLTDRCRLIWGCCTEQKLKVKTENECPRIFSCPLAPASGWGEAHIWQNGVYWRMVPVNNPQ